MDQADYIAQALFVIFLLVCITFRKVLIDDSEDGNVERLIRIEEQNLNSMEAKLVLASMRSRRVS